MTQEQLLLQFISWLDSNGMIDVRPMLRYDEIVDDNETLYLRLIEEFENDN